MRALLMLALLACTGGEGTDKDPSTDSGGTDTGDEPIEITYPTGDRVLLYYGNGGFTEQGTGQGGFEDVDSHLMAIHGWSTDHRDYLPDDLSSYRMIGLIGLGTNGGSSVVAADVLQLVDALAIGTRLVFFADRDDCVTDVATSLMADLGVSLSYTDDAADFNSIIQTDSFNSIHQISTGVADVRFKEPCWVDPLAGETVAQDDERNAIITAERPGTGGEVVVAGDFQFFDDSGYLEYGDNARLIENMAFVTPVE